MLVQWDGVYPHFKKIAMIGFWDAGSSTIVMFAMGNLIAMVFCYRANWEIWDFPKSHLSYLCFSDPLWNWRKVWRFCLPHSDPYLKYVSTWAINVGEDEIFGGCAHPVKPCAEAEKYLAKSREFCVEPQV